LIIKVGVRISTAFICRSVIVVVIERFAAAISVQNGRINGSDLIALAEAYAASGAMV
jgi:hypothetical protein